MNALALVSMNEFPTPSPEIEIVPTTAAHVRALSATMREMDRREVQTFGWSAEKSLWRSFKRSVQVKTCLIDGAVAAIWGVGGEYMGEVGAPWLLTNENVYKVSALKFTRIYQIELKSMQQLFPTLSNYVLSDYSEAVRMLEIVGFELGEPELIGKEMFRKFTMRSS